MNYDNCILFIIFIVTIIMISLLKECNKDRLKELGENSIKTIIEAFSNYEQALANESGEWGYEIVGISEGKYGGRSRQQVINKLLEVGSHIEGDYISESEKQEYGSDIFDSTITGEIKPTKVNYGDCLWSDSDGNQLDSTNPSGTWIQKINSIEYGDGTNNNVIPCDTPIGGEAIDCIMDYGDWSDCSGVMCGGSGTQTRNNTIELNSAYGGKPCDPLSETRNCYNYSCSVTFNVIGNNIRLGNIEYWTVNISGEYNITLYGADGGDCNGGESGGRGMKISSNFNLENGNVLKIIVGKKGQDGVIYNSGGKNKPGGGGGGGGSFVYIDDVIALVAGGGGGGGRNSTGGDATTNGTEAGKGKNGGGRGGGEWGRVGGKAGGQGRAVRVLIKMVKMPRFT